MRFYNRQHRRYCGIDLHVKTMYVCILDAGGQVLVHRNVKSTPDAFLAVVASYREDLVVAAEGIAFVLGHPLAMKAIHAAKAKNDKIDSQKIAALVRGELLPQAYVYPAAMRSTRDLLRRRLAANAILQIVPCGTHRAGDEPQETQRKPRDHAPASP